MADIGTAYSDAESALGRPALALLTRKAAPAILAIFTTVFTAGPIPADRFLAVVGNHFQALREQGRSGVPENLTTRAVVNTWVNEGWLLYATTPDGDEQYALTSHSQTALDYVGRAGKGRAMVSQSRIRSILEAARECADAANPDRPQRIARLDADIASFTKERERLASGGDIVQTSDERVIEAYLNLKELLDQLPADFLRVTESVESEQRIILADFHAEAVSTGTVVSDYLDRAAASLLQTQEGRAFQGAQELLRDPSLMDQLRRDVDTTLAHPIAETLTLDERKAFRGTPTLLESNVGSVLSKRHQNTRTIQQYVSRRAASTDKEVDSLVTQLKAALLEWAPVGKARDGVPAAVQIAQVDIGHLQQKLYDPSDHRPPPPLVTVSTEGGGLDLAELLQQGGPRLEALKAVLSQALTAADAVPAAAAFNGSPTDLRRPVEILGYLQLAERAGAMTTTGETDVYEAVRPDGSRKAFRAARAVFSRSHLPHLEPATPSRSRTS